MVNMQNNLPATYEEYGKLNDFGPAEMEDEYAPLAKELYEKMAAIVNEIEPFTDEEKNMKPDIDLLGAFLGVVELSRRLGHMSEDTYFDLMDFWYEEDIPAEVGFIVDELIEFFDIRHFLDAHRMDNHH